MPAERSHDPAIVRGHLHVRPGGLEVSGHEFKREPDPCPQCSTHGVEPLDDHPLEPKLGCRACGETVTHLLQRLPCETCRDGATLPGPDRKPYLMGGTPGEWPFRYACAGCKRTMTLTAPEWNQLRSLPPEEYLEILGDEAP